MQIWGMQKKKKNNHGTLLVCTVVLIKPVMHFLNYSARRGWKAAKKLIMFALLHRLLGGQKEKGI